MNLAGHVWTLGAYLGRRVGKPVFPGAVAWSTRVADPRLGAVRLTGWLGGPAASDAVVLLVHGLGGCAESTYMLRAARCVERRGSAHLRLNLRGADRRGEDFYHAGLTDDLHAAVASSQLSRYRRLVLLGFSLGGHVALRFATETTDPRVRGVAAICSPLDLAACARAIDRPGGWLYRSYLLRCKREIYAAVARRRPVPVPLGEVRRIRTLQEFDHRVVAPRHGFASGADYYQRASVGPLLGHLRLPALLLAAEDDPMVPAATLSSFLSDPPPRLSVRRVGRGGHVAFPPHLDLGEAGERGMEPQVLAWLGRQ